MQSYKIRQEQNADRQPIRDLHELAFGDTIVPNLTDALRSVARPPLEPISFMAETRGEVVGHVMLSAARLDAPLRLVDVYVLSPLGVLPSHQRRGIGTALIQHALEAANSKDVPLVFLEGDPKFYGPRGFKRATEIGFRSPSLPIPERAFQVLPMDTYEPWMTGTLVYSDTFWALDCVGLR